MARLLGLVRPAEGGMRRNLDHVVEAQGHEDVRLGRDIDVLVADPPFRSKEVGASGSYKRPIWLSLEMIQGITDDGGTRPTMPSLAERIARYHVVDVEAIGKAVQEVRAGGHAQPKVPLEAFPEQSGEDGLQDVDSAPPKVNVQRRNTSGLRRRKHEPKRGAGPSAGRTRSRARGGRG